MRIGGNIHLDDLDGDGVTDLVLATRLRASLIP